MFTDRRQAGRLLAERLRDLRGSGAVVLGVLPDPATLIFAHAEGTEWLSGQRGHRAIGVVYDPRRESGNYVPTVMGRRYDALIWIPETTALQPLAGEGHLTSPEFETEPTGF